jgi:guanine deaminase
MKAEKMIDYHVAIRGALFDIAQVCDNADDIALNARFIEDGLLFIATERSRRE